MKKGVCGRMGRIQGMRDEDKRELEWWKKWKAAKRWRENSG